MVMEPHLSMLDAVVSGTSAARERGAKGEPPLMGVTSRPAPRIELPSRMERKDGGVLQDMLIGDQTKT